MDVSFSVSGFYLKFLRYILVSAIIFCIYACEVVAPVHKEKSKVTFQSLEVGYSNGWGSGFQFLVDSEQVFMGSFGLDTLLVGRLPDSTWVQLNEVVKLIQQDSIRSHNTNCCDCGVLVLLLKTTKDTAHIYQRGNLSYRCYPLIYSLKALKENGVGHKIRGTYPFIVFGNRVLPPLIPVPKSK